MLNFAAFCPHPPIIIPEIGKNELVHTEKTRLAMQTLGKRFAKKEPEKVIVISPHTLLLHNTIALSHASEITGSLAAFNAPELILSFNGEKKLAEEIHQKAGDSLISTQLVNEENDLYPLSHGEIVPLHFLSKDYSNFDLIISGFSNFSLEKHFEYGKLLGEIIYESPEKIAVIASGDLSHRLKVGAPAGYSPYAQEFDENILKWTKKRMTQKIIEIDPHLVSEAGECGLRSLVILLGILEYFKYSVEILAYEAPFGVGYATADFRVI